MKTNILLAIMAVFGLSFSSFAVDAYKGCFTKAIYDQSWADETTTPEEKTQELLKRKRAAIWLKLIQPLDNELEVLKDAEGMARFSFALKALIGFGMGASSSTVIGAAIIGIPLARLAYLRESDANSFEEKARALEKSRHDLLQNLVDSEMAQLESRYVIKKCKLDIRLQDTIEQHFLNAYDSGADHSQILEDLISFPIRIACLAMRGDTDTFLRKLAERKEWLESKPLGNNFMCKEALGLIAKASYNVAIGEKPRRCSIYFHDANGLGKTTPMLKLIAECLGRPVVIFDAKTVPTLDDAFLYGKKGQNRGLLLEPFLVRKEGENILNPLLIIINADHWVTNEKNEPFLLRLFDPDAESFHSNYFDLDINFSAMCVLCSGTTPSMNFSEKIRSLLQCYAIAQ